MDYENVERFRQCASAASEKVVSGESSSGRDIGEDLIAEGVRQSTPVCVPKTSSVLI